MTNKKPHYTLEFDMEQRKFLLRDNDKGDCINLNRSIGLQANVKEGRAEITITLWGNLKFSGTLITPSIKDELESLLELAEEYSLEPPIFEKEKTSAATDVLKAKKL